MHNFDLIATITGGFAAALVLGYITNRLGLSPIVGYLLAGFAVGPNTPGFVANKALADQLAEIGVILLMFGVGLQFHLKELLAVRRVAIPGAIFQSLGILDDRATNTLVAAAIVSISLNPLLYRLIDPLEAWLQRRRQSKASNQLTHEKVEADDREISDDLIFNHRAIIVGYGPVGRTVARLLRENEIEPIIIIHKELFGGALAADATATASESATFKPRD